MKQAVWIFVISVQFVASQPLETPGNQPQNVALRQQPAVVNSGNQLQNVAVREQPAVVNSGNQPQNVALREQPAVVNPGTKPQNIALREQPAVTNSGNQPQNVAVRERPAVVNSRNQPQNVALHQPPAVINSENPLPNVAWRQQPAVVNSGNQPQNVALHQQPAVVNSGNQPQNVALHQQPAVVNSGNQLPNVARRQQLAAVNSGNQPQNVVWNQHGFQYPVPNYLVQPGYGIQHVGNAITQQWPQQVGHTYTPANFGVNQISQPPVYYSQPKTNDIVSQIQETQNQYLPQQVLSQLQIPRPSYPSIQPSQTVHYSNPANMQVLQENPQWLYQQYPSLQNILARAQAVVNSNAPRSSAEENPAQIIIRSVPIPTQPNNNQLFSQKPVATATAIAGGLVSKYPVANTRVIVGSKPPVAKGTAIAGPAKPKSPVANAATLSGPPGSKPPVANAFAFATPPGPKLPNYLASKLSAEATAITENAGSPGPKPLVKLIAGSPVPKLPVANATAVAGTPGSKPPVANATAIAESTVSKLPVANTIAIAGPPESKPTVPQKIPPKIAKAIKDVVTGINYSVNNSTTVLNVLQAVVDAAKKAANSKTDTNEPFNLNSTSKPSSNPDLNNLSKIYNDSRDKLKKAYVAFDATKDKLKILAKEIQDNANSNSSPSASPSPDTDKIRSSNNEQPSNKENPSNKEQPSNNVQPTKNGQPDPKPAHHPILEGENQPASEDGDALLTANSDAPTAEDDEPLKQEGDEEYDNEFASDENQETAGPLVESSS